MKVKTKYTRRKMPVIFEKFIELMEDWVKMEGEEAYDGTSKYSVSR